ncbi:hypothetical protein FF1_030570 [Malus domestica]
MDTLLTVFLFLIPILLLLATTKKKQQKRFLRAHLDSRNLPKPRSPPSNACQHRRNMASTKNRKVWSSFEDESLWKANSFHPCTGCKQVSIHHRWSTFPINKMTSPFIRFWVTGYIGAEWQRSQVH